MTEPTLKPFLSAVARAESFNYRQAKLRAKRLRNAPPVRAESSLHVAALSPAEGIAVCSHAIVVVANAVLAASCAEVATLPVDYLSVVNVALAALADRREGAPTVDLAPLRTAPNASHAKHSAPRPHVVPAIDDSALPHAFDDDGDRFVCDLPELPPFRADPLSTSAGEVYGYSTAYMLAIDSAIGGATHAALGEIDGMTCLFLYGPGGMGLVVPARIPVAPPTPKPEPSPLAKAVAPAST